MDVWQELSDATLDDIEMRLNKGWVVRPDQIRALVQMARQRNYLKREAEEKDRERKDD